MYYQEKQKNELLNEEKRDFLNKIEQLKKNQTQILDLFNLKSTNSNNNDLKLNLEMKIENIQKNFERERENLENDFLKQRQILNNEIDNKEKNINNLSEKLKILTNEKSDLTNKLKLIEDKNKEITRQLNFTEEIRKNFDKEVKKQNKNLIEEYEKKLLNKENSHQNDIKKLNKNSENTKTH